MAAKKTTRKRKQAHQGGELLQVRISKSMADRFYASDEYQTHGKATSALREILDRALPKTSGAT